MHAKKNRIEPAKEKICFQLMPAISIPKEEETGGIHLDVASTPRFLTIVE